MDTAYSITHDYLTVHREQLTEFILSADSPLVGRTGT